MIKNALKVSHSMIYFPWLIGILFIVPGCTSIPEGVKAVDQFDVNRYTGKWYEIARLDHPFERGLRNITAHYKLREDGGLDVLNKGFDTEEKSVRTAKAKAYFIADKSTGRLKVSFFWPFYSSYNIIALDKDNYEYAMICGPDFNYLWILARKPDLKLDQLNALIDQAKSYGFNTDELIFVKHDTP